MQPLIVTQENKNALKALYKLSEMLVDISLAFIEARAQLNHVNYLATSQDQLTRDRVIEQTNRIATLLGNFEQLDRSFWDSYNAAGE